MLNSIAFFLFLHFNFNSFLLSRIAWRSFLEYLGFLSVLLEYLGFLSVLEEEKQEESFL